MICLSLVNYKRCFNCITPSYVRVPHQCGISHLQALTLPASHVAERLFRSDRAISVKGQSAQTAHDCVTAVLGTSAPSVLHLSKYTVYHDLCL